MTTALIVDDSSVDRELVRSLLQRGSSLDIEFADDGAAALDRISESPPSIVITDLHMPNVDGLQLVETIHEKYAAIPVVLITGKGSEDLAVQALKKGAASYVPKADLASELFRTVMQVLAIARANQSLKEVQACWNATRCTFELPNDYNLISPLVKQVMQIVEGMQLFDDTERVRLAVALEEAISNALYHGNLELTSDQIHSDGYDLADPDAPTIVDTRRSSSPYKDRRIFVMADLDRTQVRFNIRDEGPGFDHAAVPTPEEVVASGELQGRGLAKMHLFTDELLFNDEGNQVTLVKRSP